MIKTITPLGRCEYALIRGKNAQEWRRFKVKLDIGAYRSRIGAKEAAKLRLGPIEGVKNIKTGSATDKRMLVPAIVQIGGHRIKVHFTVSTMRRGVLIGRRTMGKRFKIYPWRTYLSRS